MHSWTVDSDLYWIVAFSGGPLVKANCDLDFDFLVHSECLISYNRNWSSGNKRKIECFGAANLSLLGVIEGV